MKRITKIKWLKVSLIISIVMVCLYAIAQDEPSGYTSWFRLRMWEEGDHPGADSVNQNLIDIDLHLHNRDKRIDSLKSAYMEMFNFPSGTWKRYDSTVFDGDSLKFKTGIIPKLPSNNTFTGTNNFSSTQTDFGDGTVIFDLNLTPGEGVFQIRDNSDPLLIYDDDTQTWDFQYPVSINGVPITSGGGDAYLTNRQTFTKRNVFSDTLKADGLSLIDNARITSNLNVTGDVISDLNFLKGSLTNIGTISNDSLAFITNNTQRMVITKDGKILFLDSVRVSNAIAIFDSAKISVDMSMLSDSSGINWTSGGLSQIYQLPSPANILAFKQNEFDFFTKKGNQILYLDSLNGMTLNYGVYTGNGSGLTTLNASNLSSGTILQSRLSDSVYKLSNLDTTRFLDKSDTSSFFRVGDIFTPIYEVVNSIVTFAAAVTFTVSPIFSALVNFPNGINVTGNGTFNGDIVSNGWTEQGGQIALDRYYRDTILRAPSMAIGNNITVAHGISNINRVVELSAVIKDDSSGILVPCSGASGFVLYSMTPWMDATNVYLRITGNQLNLDDNTDTVKFYIRYTNYQR